MEWEIGIVMDPEDNVGVLTKDGKFVGVCGPSEKYVRERADMIHEAMIAVMKVEDHRVGFWSWVISHGWTQMRGEKIQTKGDEDEKIKK